MLGRETVVRHRPGGVDSLGDPVASTEPDKTIRGCVVYPRGTAEDAGRSATVVAGYTLLAPNPQEDIKPSDEIWWRGDWYTVEGQPGPWYHLDGTDGCLQVALKLGRN